MAKNQPVAELEKPLLAGVKVDAAAMRESPVQRGVATGDSLAVRDLPPDSVFWGAVKAVLPEAK